MFFFPWFLLCGCAFLLLHLTMKDTCLSFVVYIGIHSKSYRKIHSILLVHHHHGMFVCLIVAYFVFPVASRRILLCLAVDGLCVCKMSIVYFFVAHTASNTHLNPLIDDRSPCLLVPLVSIFLYLLLHLLVGSLLILWDIHAIQFFLWLYLFEHRFGKCFIVSSLYIFFDFPHLYVLICYELLANLVLLSWMNDLL